MNYQSEILKIELKSLISNFEKNLENIDLFFKNLIDKKSNYDPNKILLDFIELYEIDIEKLCFLKDTILKFQQAPEKHYEEKLININGLQLKEYLNGEVWEDQQLKIFEDFNYSFFVSKKYVIYQALKSKDERFIIIYLERDINSVNPLLKNHKKDWEETYFAYYLLDVTKEYETSKNKIL